MAFVYWLRLEEHTDITSEGYVGVTSQTVNQRFIAHCSLSNQGSETHLHRAMRKYGQENFIVETILEGSVEYCFLMEGRLRPTTDIGYNMAIGGSISPMIGRGHSEETKKKISAKSKLNRHSDETKAKIGSKHKGKILSEETRKLLSEKRKGVPLSEATRAAISKGRMGIRNSPESIARSAAGLRHRPKTEAHKKAMSLAQKGKKQSLEKRQRQSLRMQSEGPWSNPKANLSVWSSAEFLSALCQMYHIPNIERITGFSKNSLYTIVAKLKAGWNPSEDLLYMEWLTKYKQTQESQNVP